MLRDNWPLLALGALVLAALAAAFSVVRGPATGRMEAHDEQRLSELRQLTGHVACLARENGGTLPAALVASETCPTPLDEQAFLLREGYRYEVFETGDYQSYRLCTTFEAPERMVGWGDFDPRTGCLSDRYFGK